MDYKNDNVAYMGWCELPFTKENPAERHVYWALGDYCTYACSYCPERYHANKYNYQPLDKIKQTIDKFDNFNQPMRLIFGGGEPTYHPNFVEIVDYVPEKFKVVVISNGARPLSWWERVVDRFYFVVLSYHSEYAKLERFLEVAKLAFVEKKKKGRVHLVMNPGNWEQCQEIHEIFVQNNIPVMAKPVVEDFNALTKNQLTKTYTESQLDWLEKANYEPNRFLPINFYNKNNEVIFRTDPGYLLSSNMTDFRGWECYAPVQALYINTNGSVTVPSCAQTVKLGTIFDDFTLPMEPVICKTDYCWCQIDVIAHKKKI